jgi:hypothetical protein
MKTEADCAKAAKAVALMEQWKMLKEEQHLSGSQAAKLLHKSAVWFSRYRKSYEREGLAAFTRERGGARAARRLFTDLPPWFLPGAKFFHLNTNLSRTKGCVPEAIRRTIALPKWPPAVQARLARICADADLRSGRAGSFRQTNFCPR